MGNFIKPLFTATPPRILLLGLDLSGKTSIVYKLQLGQTIATIPTIGFNVEEIEFNGAKLVMWDLGGQEKVRSLWRHYFAKTSALVYVVDSSDVDRLEESCRELHQVLNDQLLKDVRVLIFATKQDLKEALKKEQLTKYLKTDEIKQVWNMQLCSSVTGEGLKEGLEWVLKNLK